MDDLVSGNWYVWLQGFQVRRKVMNRYYWRYTDCIWSENLESIELALTTKS